MRYDPLAKQIIELIDENTALRARVAELEAAHEAVWIATAAREEVARWMIKHSYATGHGDTLDDLLDELVAQITMQTGDRLK